MIFYSKAIKTIGYWAVLSLPMASSPIFSQGVVEQIDPQGESASDNALDLSTETIEKVSPSGRIYLLTNGNASFQKGDFISLVFKNNLVARALVAKTAPGLGGVKIMRVYSQEMLGLLKPGVAVQIIRGDDGRFRRKVGEDKKNDSKLQIKDEDDLFNESAIVEEEVVLTDRGTRLIKQDNILSLVLGRIEGRDLAGASTRYNQLNAAWAYQVADNIWAEFSYGQNTIGDFPETGLTTRLSNMTIKGKYIISAPAYSFISPYVGYQIVDASSPSAGVQDPSSPVSAQQLNLEIERVESLKKHSPIFGISVLKRLVPGWFARLDLGSDIVSFGFALEF